MKQDITKSISNYSLISLDLYYKADIAESNNIILELVKNIGDNSFAVNSVNNSEAFPGIKTNELQFFRSRLGTPNKTFTAKDMLHLPNSMRSKSGTIDLVFLVILVCIWLILHMDAG